MATDVSTAETILVENLSKSHCEKCHLSEEIISLLPRARQKRKKSVTDGYLVLLTLRKMLQFFSVHVSVGCFD